MELKAIIKNNLRSENFEQNITQDNVKAFMKGFESPQIILDGMSYKVRVAARSDPENLSTIGKSTYRFVQVNQVTNDTELNHVYATSRLNKFRHKFPWFIYLFDVKNISVGSDNDKYFYYETNVKDYIDFEEFVVKSPLETLKNVFTQMLLAVTCAFRQGVVNIKPVIKICRSENLEIRVNEDIKLKVKYFPVFTFLGAACSFEDNKLVNPNNFCGADKPMPSLQEELNRFRMEFFDTLKIYRKDLDEKNLITSFTFPNPDYEICKEHNENYNKLYCPLGVPINDDIQNIPLRETIRFPKQLTKNLMREIAERINVLSGLQLRIKNAMTPENETKYLHIVDIISHVANRHNREINCLLDEYALYDEVKDGEVCENYSGSHSSIFHDKIISDLKTQVAAEEKYVNQDPSYIDNSSDFNKVAGELLLAFKTKFYLASAQSVICLAKHNDLKIKIINLILKLDAKIGKYLSKLRSAYDSLQISLDDTTTPYVNFIFVDKAPAPAINLINDVVNNIVEIQSPASPAEKA